MNIWAQKWYLSFHRDQKHDEASRLEPQIPLLWGETAVVGGDSGSSVRGDIEETRGSRTLDVHDADEETCSGSHRSRWRQLWGASWQEGQAGGRRHVFLKREGRSGHRPAVPAVVTGRSRLQVLITHQERPQSISKAELPSPSPLLDLFLHSLSLPVSPSLFCPLLSLPLTRYLLFPYHW